MECAIAPSSYNSGSSSYLSVSPLTEEELLSGVPETRKSNACTPLPRPARLKRPHTKSRRGCFSCKSRRIKCQETKPACANCIHKDLECIYPATAERAVVAERSSRAHSAIPSQNILPSRQLSTTPFTGDDLRFWHHFLIDARPHLPFGNETAWMSDIPAYAHDCPHLLHAILSLGASHYALITPHGTKHIPTAIAYRGKALKALGATLAKGDNCTVPEMDGALATCYALTFQAHHLHDGVVDFAVMVRGCGIVTNWFLEKRPRGSMFNLPTIEVITSWLPSADVEIKDRETVEACIASLERLYPFLQTSAQHSFYNSLRAAYESLCVSYQAAFVGIATVYASWYSMENTEFLTFIAPGNYISRALFMHYIAVDSFMLPLYLELGRTHNLRSSGGHFLTYRWAEALHNGLPVAMRELVSDAMGFLALDLEPQLEFHRRLFPQWDHELVAFEGWLRRRLPVRLNL